MPNPRGLPVSSTVTIATVATATVALAASALAALATIPAVVSVAVAAAAVTVAAAVAAGDLLCHRLRPLHRRSARPELHSLAQLSVGLQQQPNVLHRADAARHWKAPVSGRDVDQPLLYAVGLRLSPHT